MKIQSKIRDILIDANREKDEFSGSLEYSPRIGEIHEAARLAKSVSCIKILEKLSGSIKILDFGDKNTVAAGIYDPESGKYLLGVSSGIVTRTGRNFVYSVLIGNLILHQEELKSNEIVYSSDIFPDSNDYPDFYQWQRGRQSRMAFPSEAAIAKLNDAPKIEKMKSEALIFAFEFLMPESKVRRFYESCARVSVLADHFVVSDTIMMFRMRNLGLKID